MLYHGKMYMPILVNKCTCRYVHCWATCNISKCNAFKMFYTFLCKATFVIFLKYPAYILSCGQLYLTVYVYKIYIWVYNIFLDEPFLYFSFFKYVHFTRCIRVYMCTLSSNMLSHICYLFDISTIHSFMWTTILECVRVQDIYECTIFFLTSHFVFFFNTSTLTDVSIRVYMCTLSSKSTPKLNYTKAERLNVQKSQNWPLVLEILPPLAVVARRILPPLAALQVNRDLLFFLQKNTNKTKEFKALTGRHLRRSV